MGDLLRLYIIFLKIGGVTFGGGLAMFPILHHEFIEKRGWITERELTDYYAIGQCTPGIIAAHSPKPSLEYSPGSRRFT